MNSDIFSSALKFFQKNTQWVQLLRFSPSRVRVFHSILRRRICTSLFYSKAHFWIFHKRNLMNLILWHSCDRSTNLNTWRRYCNGKISNRFFKIQVDVLYQSIVIRYIHISEPALFTQFGCFEKQSIRIKLLKDVIFLKIILYRVRITIFFLLTWCFVCNYRTLKHETG